MNARMSPRLRGLAASMVVGLAPWAVAFGAFGCSLSSDLDSLKGGVAGGAPGGAGGKGGTGGIGGTGGWVTGGSSNGGAPAGGSAGTGAAGSGGSGTETCADCGQAGCECAPPAPTGWDHAHLVETKDATQPACPAGHGMPILLGTGARDTGCAACECSSPTGSQCSKQFRAFTTSACQGSGTDTSTVPAPTGCASLDSSVSSYNAAGVTGGTCTASAKLEPPEFELTATVCRVQSFGPSCSGNRACVPTVTPPFQPAHCVVAQAEGDLECPPGFPQKKLCATGFSDQRTCTGCQCGAASGGTCTGGAIKWCLQANCAQCSIGGTPWQSCAGGPGWLSAQVLSVGSPAGGSCAPTGSAVSSGGLTTTGARAVCCAI